MASTPLVRKAMTDWPDNYRVHLQPVWRDQGDCVIRVPIENAVEMYEVLWARFVAEFRFEVCCIPFFAYDIALGDLIETDEGLDFGRVVKPSGRYVFRAWFGESSFPAQDVALELVAMGAMVEWASSKLLAIDAVDTDLARQVAEVLGSHQQADNLIYENGAPQL